LRSASRRVERVLLAAADDAEAAVEDAEVGVQRGADAEVELAVVLVAVEPVAVVGVAIAAHRGRDRLGRLVDRVVVELAEHWGPPGESSMWRCSTACGGSVTPACEARSRRTPRNTGGVDNLRVGPSLRDRDPVGGDPPPVRSLPLLRGGRDRGPGPQRGARPR